MTGLLTLTQTQLDAWVVQAIACTRLGRLPDYIPLLAKANPHWVAVLLQQVNGKSHSAGEVEQPFTLMSVIKPLVLLFLLEQLGWEQVFTHVGMDPSNQSFHSLTQLREDRGFPRNPMINSGAIALASLLPGEDGTSRCEALRQWLNQMSGSHLVLDEQMLASVRSLSNEANRAIAELLSKSGYLGSVETALNTYNQICCLSGTVADLAKLGMLLAAGDVRTNEQADAKDLIQNSKFKISPQPSALSPQHLKTVNALMLTCGLYEASGRFAVRIGLPIKSGVSGALLSIVPGQGAIACYSPALDSTGNSVAGLFLIEKLAQELNLSIFSA
jgi:glutaminase